jgi:hypothetical protein
MRTYLKIKSFGAQTTLLAECLMIALVGLIWDKDNDEFSILLIVKWLGLQFENAV